MTVNQIYALINTINADSIKGEINVVDAASFVNFGNLVLTSSENKEKFYNTLVDRIGKTVFAIREYEKKNRNVTVDAFTFGSILQKISYKLQNAENNSTWDNAPLNPYTLEPKGGIEQKLFATELGTWAYTDVILDSQLNSAFVNEMAFSGFVNGLYIRMRNSLEVAKENTDNVAIASLVAEVFNEVKTATKNSRRARNLLAEYNALHPTTTLTESNCWESEEFLEFCCVEMGTVIPFMGRMTSMFNNGEVERVTRPEDLIVEVNSVFEKKYDVYLKANTFHDSMVALPNYESVAYWLFPTDPMLIKIGPNETATEIKNVIAIFRDKDAVVDTFENEKTVSMYDSINERTYVKASCNRRFIADTSENVVFFYVADAV